MTLMGLLGSKTSTQQQLQISDLTVHTTTYRDWMKMVDTLPVFTREINFVTSSAFLHMKPLSENRSSLKGKMLLMGANAIFLE